MIHYSCDRCKRKLNAVDDLRYVVKLEVQAAMSPACEDDVQDDRDHLMEIEDILEGVMAAEDDQIGEEIYQRRSFDLCSSCYRKFLANPLGRDLQPAFGFSKN